MATIACVVPISGGKDSQACLQLALEFFPADQIRGLFCDTKWEHPLTYTHIDFMREYYGVEIDTVNAGSVPEKVMRYKRFPGGGARHCTDELKIIPTKKYLWWLATLQGHGFEVWYGMRTGESAARGARYKKIISDDLYPPHEILPKKYPKYLFKMGVRFKLPILNWTDVEVLSFLGHTENPLYDHGFTRVGCFPCLAAGDHTKQLAFKHDVFGAEQFDKTQALENVIEKSVWTSKIGKGTYKNECEQGCAICAI